MNQRLRSRLRLLFALTAAAGTGGALYGLMIAASFDNPGIENFSEGVLRGLWTGTSIALPLTAWEIFYVNGAPGTWLRRRPFIQHLAVRTLVYLCVIVAGLWSAALFFAADGETVTLDSEIISQLAISFIISLIANFAMSLNRLMGQSVFLNFLTGRYHQPKTEYRVLLFADLSGSTALAEEIGDLAFHRYLNDLYRVLTGPVIENRGTIHKYVGDEMIVSWRDNPANRRRALQCGMLMQEALAAASAAFQKTYGHPPHIRCGIHSGPIIAGEMGDVRQEIVYLGDAMNVTARLVEACRDFAQSVLVSNAVLEAVDVSEFAKVSPLGDLPIRGRQQSLAVSGLSGRE